MADYIKFNEYWEDPDGFGHQDREQQEFVEHPKLGRILVYREFKPMKDVVEYTIYHKDEHGNHRTDFDIEAELIARHSADWINGYVNGLATAHGEETLIWDAEQRRGRG